MTIKEKNQIIYKYACEFLKNILPRELKEEDLEKYYEGDNSKFSSLKEVFIQIIRSAQNYQGMPNIIKFNERFDDIGRILYDYDYNLISQLEVTKLYHKFRKEFNVTSKDSKMNSWFKWSTSIIDAANFIKNFKDVEGFKNFVNLYDYNTLTRRSLPLLISSKIRGIGFALACDCLKELGYLNYPKPDRHIVGIFTKLGLSDNNQMNVFDAVICMYEDCKNIDNRVTPYKIDKILWLISSGTFYLDNIDIGRHREEFIEKVTATLKCNK